MSMYTAVFLTIVLGLFSFINGSGPAEVYAQRPQVGEQFIFNEDSKPANDPDSCAKYGEQLSAKAIPDYNLCDLVVYRQSPAIIRTDGMIMNNFSGMSHYIEFIPASINNTSTFGQSANNNTNSQNAMVVGFGEFALIDPEVVPVHQVMDKYNWTLTSLHHHMLDEKPKVLFLHWTVTGNPDELVQQAKEILAQTSTYNATENNKTPSTAGP